MLHRVPLHTGAHHTLRPKGDGVPSGFVTVLSGLGNSGKSIPRFSPSTALRHYATNRKVAGSIPDEVNF
jgi:hypothetical protein